LLNQLIGSSSTRPNKTSPTARDEEIGWNVEQRSNRLYNVLDAFVLGAVPPYRELLGGKLVAMAAISDTTREMIFRKYHGQRTEILGEVKQTPPVLITTTSALGRSSIYNRIKYGNELLYQPVGYTKGYGHFQFSEPLYAALVEYLDDRDALPGHQYGDGPNWRMRTLRVALTALDLDPELIHHGIKRQVFLAPLAKYWKEFLNGERERPSWTSRPLADLGAYFCERWATKRADSDASFKAVISTDMKLID
jgi:hypothetical protein